MFNILSVSSGLGEELTALSSKETFYTNMIKGIKWQIKQKGMASLNLELRE